MTPIRFIAQGANSLVGGFSHGDIARVSDALARHLVEEANVAEYVTAHAVPVTEEAQPKKQRRGRA